MDKIYQKAADIMANQLAAAALLVVTKTSPGCDCPDCSAHIIAAESLNALASNYRSGKFVVDQPADSE